MLRIELPPPRPPRLPRAHHVEPTRREKIFAVIYLIVLLGGIALAIWLHHKKA